MSGTTNELIEQTKELSKNFDAAEYDVLLSTGEQATCALIAGRLKHLGLRLDLGCLGKCQSLPKVHIAHQELIRLIKIKYLIL